MSRPPPIKVNVRVAENQLGSGRVEFLIDGQVYALTAEHARMFHERLGKCVTYAEQWKAWRESRGCN